MLYVYRWYSYGCLRKSGSGAGLRTSARRRRTLLSFQTAPGVVSPFTVNPTSPSGSKVLHTATPPSLSSSSVRTVDFNISLRSLTSCTLDLFPMYAKPALYLDILLIDILQGQLGQPPAPRDGSGEVQTQGRLIFIFCVEYTSLRFASFSSLDFRLICDSDALEQCVKSQSKPTTRLSCTIPLSSPSTFALLCSILIRWGATLWLFLLALRDKPLDNSLPHHVVDALRLAQLLS